MIQTVQIQPATNIIQIDNWQEYWRDGEQFLRTAVNALAKGRRVFTPEILYNITAMAIEKYIMAFLMINGDLAENHTMGDLATALERHTGPLPDLISQLHYLDSFQEICDIETSHYVQPTTEQIAGIVHIGQEVERYVVPFLEGCSSK
jgi:hypothetical protein